MTAIDINSTNRVAVGKVRETTFAVTPATPAIQAVRYTSSTLAVKPMTVVSDEIRSDRQVTDLTLVGTQADGDMAAELSFQAEDGSFEEALQSAWSASIAITNIAAGIQISALTATTATVASGGAAFLANTLVLLTGFPTAGNNKVAVASSNSGTTVVFPSSTFVAETATIPVGAALRVVGFAGASADIVATAAGLTSTALDFTTLPLVVGMWIKIGGAGAGTKYATAANNDFVRISAIAAHVLTLERLPTGWTADVGTGKTIWFFFGEYLRNGTTMVSNTFERQYLDQSPVNYEYITGMVLSKMSLKIEAQKIVTMVKSYLGSTGTIGSTRISGATDLSASAYPVLNATSNIGRLAVGGNASLTPNFILDISLDINNNLRTLYAVGVLGAIGEGDGEFTVTGSLNSYFGDATFYNQLLTNADTSLDFRIGGSDTNKETYLFDFPRARFSSGSPTVAGKNQNVMLPLGFQAIRSVTYGYTLHMQRFWYLE